MDSKSDTEPLQPLFSDGVYSMRMCVCSISHTINYSLKNKVTCFSKEPANQYK